MSRFYFSSFGMKATEPISARERVARVLDRMREALLAPTPLAWALASVFVLVFALVIKATHTDRFADFLYWLWLETLGGDR